MNRVIHLSTDADLENYTYTQVYCGTAGTITLNGISVVMAESASIEIIVTSITGAAGVYLLGNKTIKLPSQIL